MINTDATAVLLFQHNLRLHDNPALVAAAKHKRLICLYCYDDWQFDTQFGLSHCGPHRAGFIWQSLQDLRAKLHELGQHLYIVKGELNAIMAQIEQQIPELNIYMQAHASLQQHQQLSQLTQRFTCHLMPGSTLLDTDQLPFDLYSLPSVFTRFRNKVEKSWPKLSPLASPLALPFAPKLHLPSLNSSPTSQVDKRDPRRALDFVGGESAALSRLDHYIWQTKALQTYKETRNQLLGSNYSSKFSAWLATGCLSAKHIYQQVKLFEAKHGANESTYWLIFELLWRDYFAFSAQKDLASESVLATEQPKNKLGSVQQRAFESWCQGNTGNDFVDANMRELLHSGFMSNRGRQNVASYLLNELNLDWRWGAAWFEQQLIDFDQASNVGNWQYIAGMKSPNGARRFNIALQAEQYDAQGAYRRHWLKSGSANGE